MRGVYAKRSGAPRKLVRTIFVVAESPNQVMILYFNGYSTQLKNIPKDLMYWYRRIA